MGGARLEPVSEAGDDVAVPDRAQEAHRLRVQGLSWDDIAERTGYADGRVVAMAVSAWRQKVAIEQGPEFRREALDLELRRLDGLLAAFWPAAVTGDRRAAELVLKVITGRCKVLGLDRPGEDTEPKPRTILIGGDSEHYIAGIKAAMGRSG